ncbi:MAG: hypothetical protein MI723_15145 [Caulobacterales bacterium]|nr:hypothetical protein [Caulobacterales bacterium]
MSAGRIHYEVFFKRSRKDGWKLVEAHSERQEAVDQAKSLLKQHPTGSARVSKEVFEDDDRAFRSFTVFEAGGERYEDDGRADRKAELPCRGPSDLVKGYARQLITRSLSGWLKRNRALSLELLHRVDLVEKLEASNTEMQHAVQKIAIAQASASEASVQHFVKQINTLVQQATEQIYAEHRAKKIPTLKSGELASLLSDIAAKPDREHLLRGAIAQRLKNTKDWPSKLQRILDAADEAEACAEDGRWALDVVGEFLAEIAEIDEAREALLECRNELGARLDALTNLTLGVAAEAGLSEAGERLAWYFGENLFRDTRTAIARRILRDLTGPRRLIPESFEAEVDLNRTLADRLIKLAGQLFSVEEVGEAFVVRSARLLEPEAVESYVGSCENAGEALARMIELEDNIVGDHNKRKLASYLRARMGAHPTERWFVYDKTPILHRLAELANLQRRLAASGFSDQDRAEVGGLIDAMALKAEGEGRLFDTIDARPLPPLDKAATFLRLAAKGALPAGGLVDEAKRRAVKVLSGGDARAAIASGDGEARAKAAEIASLMAGLEAGAAAAA